MMHVEDTPETPCVRVNRQRLFKVLSTNIPIQWGKQAVRVEESEENVTVFFADGTSASGDLLIGVDGTSGSSESCPQTTVISVMMTADNNVKQPANTSSRSPTVRFSNHTPPLSSSARQDSAVPT